MKKTSRPKRSPVRIALTAAIALASIGLVNAAPAGPAAAADSPIASRDAGHPTADVLPTVQINGVVWDQHVIGDRVYVVGEFTSARPAGSPAGVGEVPRSNILAYDLDTGVLDTGFTASLNAAGQTVTSSPDGSVLYIGGSFTNVNGVTRYRIAALDPVSGSVLAGFNAAVDYRVNVLVATDTTLYAGGAFNYSGGNVRSRLAAFSASDGALSAWAPVASAEVHAMVLTPDGSRLIVGGKFGTLNGVTAQGTGSLDAVSGATMPWAVNTVLNVWGSSAAILDLTTDGNAIYGVAFHIGSTAENVKWEGTFSADPTTGELNWINDCHGDSYAVTVMNGFVFAVNHVHYCSNVNGFPQSEAWSDHMRHAISMTTEATGTLRPDKWGYGSFPGYPSPSIVAWAPKWQIGSYTSAEMAGWTAESTDEYLLIGGEFTAIDGTQQQGLVRFAIEPIAPAAQGPRESGASFVPQVRSSAAGQVRVSFRANWDRDDSELTYQIIRDNNTGNPIYQTTVASTFWNRPTIGFIDDGVAPGSSHNYRVRVFDGDGNTVTGNNASATVATSGQPSIYAAVVLADSPTLEWRLDETAGAVQDWATDILGERQGGVSTGQPGALIGDTSPSYWFDGGLAAYVASTETTRRPVIDTYTLEAWVRTTSNSGGRIVGFSGNQTGRSFSSQSDRHMYMTNDGSVHFGARQGSQRLTVNSTPGLNDGEWHHLVGTQGDTGLELYVDGELVDQRGDVLTGDNYYGRWRVGYDRLSNWPSTPSSESLQGWIDEVAVYEFQVLSPQRIATHYAASGRGSGNLAPSAAFSSVVSGLSVDFDGSGSSDVDGSIVSYEWDFGDGSVGSGVAPSHGYTADGTYSVSLTVTDDDGAIGSVSHDVTVAAANVAPSAAFSSVVSGLSVDFDGSGSSDVDGSIVSYEWDFGDGSVGSGVAPSHGYTADGTYSVSLTVTDDDGAIGSVSHDVTVAAANVAPSAAFSSVVSGLSVDFDGSGSSDVDGSIVSYEWDFGDGSVGSGVAPSHGYTADGTYSVSLTVTDDDGAIGSVSHDVTVSEPGPGTVFALDAFERSVSGGWGNADVGGPWSLTGSASNFGVSGGVGSMTTSPGATRRAALDAVSAAEMVASVDLSWDQAPSGGGYFTRFELRRQGSSAYVARLRTSPSSTTLTLYRIVNGASTTLGSTTVPMSYTPGDVWRLKVELVGASPTTLRTKVWNVAGAEPAWQLEETDGDTALQGAGSVELESYLSGSAGGPAINSFDNLNLQSLDGAANVAPSAAFSSVVSGLSVDFDGSGSSDVDGSIVSYEWDFGDGSVGSGVAPSHGYTADGTYSVSLTVTDDDGAIGSVSHDVTVSEPGPGTVFALDAFERSVSGGWGNADVGGPWSLTGSASNFGVSGGVGSMTTSPGATRRAALDAVSAAEMVASVDLSWDQAPSGGGYFTRFELRRQGSSAYVARLRTSPSSTTLTLYRIVNGASTTLGSTTVPLSYTPGDVWRLKVELVGASPTTLRTKVWNVAGAEPAWQLEETDGDTALQGAGSVELESYLSGSAGGPAINSFDNLNLQSL